MLEPPRPYEAQALQRPKKVQELLASGDLNEALHGAASLAQGEIDRLMKAGYNEEESGRETGAKQK
jgi:hypothetical protein